MSARTSERQINTELHTQRAMFAPQQQRPCPEAIE
jgi:hypothetical protein